MNVRTITKTSRTSHNITLNQNSFLKVYHACKSPNWFYYLFISDPYLGALCLLIDRNQAKRILAQSRLA